MLSILITLLIAISDAHHCLDLWLDDVTNRRMMIENVHHVLTRHEVAFIQEEHVFQILALEHVSALNSYAHFRNNFEPVRIEIEAYESAILNSDVARLNWTRSRHAIDTLLRYGFHGVDIYCAIKQRERRLIDQERVELIAPTPRIYH